ncbi:hypothetical protein Tco_0421616 [Tanacetum coccineum]
MIAINNQKDLVSPLPISGKKNKVKSQTMTPTLPKSQGPKALGALSKKRQQPKAKKTPSETKAANKGLPSTVSNEGTVKTMPLLEGPFRDKDSKGNKTPADMEPNNLTNADLSGTVELDTEPLQLKTFIDVQDFLLAEDEMAQESDDEEVFAAGEDMDEDTQADEEEHQSPPLNTNKLKSSHTQDTDESASDSSSPELKKYDNILPLTERQLVKASIEGYYEENVDQMDQTNKVIQAAMNSLDKNSITKGDLLNALKGVTETLKAIQYVIKEDLALNKKAAIRTEVSSLRQDTFDIKSMMTDIYQAFKVPQREGKGIDTDDQPKVQKKLVKASSIIRPDPDAPIFVPYMINGKLFYLTKEQIQVYLDKEYQIKKAEEEAKRLATTKTEVIKIVQEEAEKIGIDPKKVINAKASENFKKAQDAEMQVHKRQHTEKSALHALVPKQALSQASGRKRKHMELEPEIKVPGLECNRSLPEGVPFVNNMVIKEHEYGIFFTDVFGDQAFQRWNDIHKVRIDSLVSYLVMASMIKTLENARFSLKLKRLITEHPDQEKLQAKKVKLEVVGKPITNVPQLINTNLGITKGTFALVLKMGNPNSSSFEQSKPALVLDDSCIMERDFGRSLMGKVKYVTALPTLYIILAREGFQNLKLTYLGGLWVLIELDSIASKEISNHVGVGSWLSLLSLGCNSFVCDEIIVWVSIGGLPLKAWTNNTFAKHRMDKCDNIGIPMDTSLKLDADLSGTPMIKSLMYLTASRPDLVHATCYNARYQARPTENHLKELSDMFTKALSEDRFEYLVGRLGMRCLTLAELEFLANESA